MLIFPSDGGLPRRRQFGIWGRLETSHVRLCEVVTYRSECPSSSSTGARGLYAISRNLGPVIQFRSVHSGLQLCPDSSLILLLLRRFETLEETANRKKENQIFFPPVIPSVARRELAAVDRSIE